MESWLLREKGLGCVEIETQQTNQRSKVSDSSTSRNSKVVVETRKYSNRVE